MNPLASLESKTQTSSSQIPAEMRTKCEVWTRVMGYHRPVSQFNLGKKQEAADRQYFSETVSLNSFAEAFGGDDEEGGCCGGGCGGCCGCGEK